MQVLENTLLKLKANQGGRRPVRVFLDSADYSILSDKKRSTPQLDKLREQLIGWAESGAVEFWYSGTILSEMAPVDSWYADASVARADLLIRLCKTQALISFDQILLRELQNLRAGIIETDSRSVYSYTGDWFPENTVDILPVSWLEGIRELDVAARQQGHNRETRRKLKKQLFKSGRPTNVMSGMLAKQQFDLGEFLQKYPMRDQGARVLQDYVLGKASCSQAQEAFLASLRDPSWMIRWFYNPSNELSSFAHWVRASSNSIVEMIEQVSRGVLDFKGKIEQLRKTGLELGVSPPFQTIDRAWWLKQQDQLVIRLAKQLASRLFEISLEGHTSSHVDRLAPGFSTCIRVLPFLNMGVGRPICT